MSVEEPQSLGEWHSAVRVMSHARNASPSRCAGPAAGCGGQESAEGDTNIHCGPPAKEDPN